MTKQSYTSRKATSGLIARLMSRMNQTTPIIIGINASVQKAQAGQQGSLLVAEIGVDVLLLPAKCFESL